MGTIPPTASADGSASVAYYPSGKRKIKKARESDRKPRVNLSCMPCKQRKIKVSTASRSSFGSVVEISHKREGAWQTRWTSLQETIPFFFPARIHK